MPERLIGAVLKTVERASVPWVRIPPSPPFKRVREGSFLVCSEKKGGNQRFLPQVVLEKQVSCTALF